MQTFQCLIDKINELLTGPIMVWGVLLVGIILSCKTRFIQARKLFYSIKITIKSLFAKHDKTSGGISPFQAVATALSGTIGTGNIVGVATAITLGGAGALFWMWVSAFFGMATKYSEIVLAVHFRKKEENGGYIGGPMYYLQQVGGKKLGALFAILCLLSSFGIGNMTQSNAIVDAIHSVSTIDTTLIMILICVVIGFIIIGGIKRIANVTQMFVPFMALFYLVSCLLIIMTNLPALKGVFAEIFASAFSLKSVGGGVAGFSISKAMKVGFARGVFTNEAGLGSAPIAHAAAQVKDAHEQGMFGIFEVFFDTIVMCTLTGLVILISGLHNGKALGGAGLTLGAFQKYLGNYAAIFLAISTVFFAAASIIGWSYYGETCVKFLFKTKKSVLIYKLFYVAMIYVGSVASLDLVWGIADLLNGFMMIPNLIGIVLLSGIVKNES